MWTAQPNSATTAVTSTVAGPAAIGSQQWSVAPGGAAIEWYSKPIASSVLSGQALVVVWASTSNYVSNASMVGEIAVVNADGSNARVWGRQLLTGGFNAGYLYPDSSYSRVAGSITGPDLAISEGQRLRLRLFLDDNYTYPLRFPIAAGHTATIHYNGNSDTDGSGTNSYIRFLQTLSESSGPPPPPPPTVPGTGVLDDFNRANESPVSQAGNWAPTGIHGGSGASLSQSRLQSFGQPGYSYRVTPYFGGDMEAWATVSTRPSQADWLSIFICVQDAGSAGWDGYELRATNVNGGPDLWEVRRVDNGAATVLASTNFEIAAGGSMLLRRNGLALQFWWKTPGGAWSQKLVDELSLNDTTYRWGVIGWSYPVSVGTSVLDGDCCG